MSEFLLRRGFEYVLVLSVDPNQEDVLSSRRLLVICVKLSKSVDAGSLSKLKLVSFSIELPGLFFKAFSGLGFAAL